MEHMRQCPFEETHLIEEKKFAMHIVKCQRQHPDIKLARCSLDTSHLMREEELAQHMKTCSGRGQLDVYKYSLMTGAASRVSTVPDPADDLIINTTGPTRKGGRGGSSSTAVGHSLLDDTECWDDSDCKAYNPLENCVAKMKENSSFIVPKVNQFAEQSMAAAVLKMDTKSDSGRDEAADRIKREPSSDEDFGSSKLNERQNDLEQFGLRRNAFHGTGTDVRVDHKVRDIKQEPGSHGSGRSSGECNDRHSGERSGARRYETGERNSYGGRSDGKSYRDRERRSDGYSNRGRHDGNDYSDRYRRDRYDSESKNYRGYGRRDEDSSRSSRSNRNDRYEPYGGSYDSRDSRSGRANDYPKTYPKHDRD